MLSITTEMLHAITEHGHNGCYCDLCHRGRSFNVHLANIPETEKPYFEALYENLLEVEFDLEYHKVVLEGDWPSAIEVLETALRRAKQKQQERESNDLAAKGA